MGEDGILDIGFRSSREDHFTLQDIVRDVVLDSGAPSIRIAEPSTANMVIPMLLSHYFPTGVLGLGLTALMASFMSGMAGNVLFTVPSASGFLICPSNGLSSGKYVVETGWCRKRATGAATLKSPVGVS